MKTYDPKNIIVTFDGILLTGFADGTFLTAERNTDAYTLVIGAGGEGARARSRDKSGIVTLTLIATALGNDLLSAVAAADELGAAGVGPLLVKDLFGTTLIAAQNGWIKKVPKVEFGKEVGSREWVIECEQLEIFAGGALG